jgi:hypothetical protein
MCIEERLVSSSDMAGQHRCQQCIVLYADGRRRMLVSLADST